MEHPHYPPRLWRWGSHGEVRLAMRRVGGWFLDGWPSVGLKFVRIDRLMVLF